MKRKLVAIFLFLQILTSSGFGGTDKYKYFRLDNIITVSGEIAKIRMETTNKKNKFVILELKNTKGNKIYVIEVSPLWFYKVDVVVGSLIRVKGSLNNMKEKKIILAQSIIFEGEIYNFRDKLGFPLWRGGNRGFRNQNRKGEMRKKGKR